jgi:hypothetical protein
MVCQAVNLVVMKIFMFMTLSSVVGQEDMTKRRLIIDGMIVAAVIGFMVMPYLVPERTGAWRGGYYSLAQCTQFAVARDSVVPVGDSRSAGSQWTASITISNAGPRRAELLAAEIISRFRNGSESWPVPMPGFVLRPGAATSITVQLPVTGSDPEGPRIWELQGRYRTRDSKAAQWLMSLHDRLPRDMQLDWLIYRPGAYQGSLLGRYPENYDFMMTNELGWRFKVVSLGPDGRGLYREWRPGVEVEHVTRNSRLNVLALTTNVLGKSVIVTAATPTMLVGLGTEPPPGMITTKGELTFYRGQLDRVTDEAIRLRAPFTNSTETFESVEIRVADILRIRWVRKDADEEQREEMERVLGQHSGPVNANQPIRSQTNRTSSAAGSRR